MAAPELPHRSDADLVDEIARDRPDALEEIYHRHGRAVFGLAAKITRDRALAEDVVQDLFLRLWVEPNRFDSRRGSLRAFLMTSAASRSIDLLRAQSARREREHRRLRVGAPDVYDVEHEALDRVVSDELRDAVRLLSDDERRAVTLAYFGGHSYREVALLLGQPEGTVKSRIRAALERLRTMLDGSPRHEEALVCVR